MQADSRHARACREISWWFRAIGGDYTSIAYGEYLPVPPVKPENLPGICSWTMHVEKNRGGNNNNMNNRTEFLTL